MGIPISNFMFSVSATDKLVCGRLGFHSALCFVVIGLYLFFFTIYWEDCIVSRYYDMDKIDESIVVMHWQSQTFPIVTHLLPVPYGTATTTKLVYDDDRYAHHAT